jgi:diguanylate cyclase (GGDEF)-like protein
MKKILVLEDDKLYCQTLKKELEDKFNYQIDTLQCSKDIDMDNLNNYELIIADIFLKDSDESYIQKLSKYNVPIILITASPDSITKEENIKVKNVVDFILKTDSNRFDQIIDKIKILNYIKNIDILIADDSKTSQFINLKTIKELYPECTTLLANDGKEALEIIQNNDKIKLILTDYEMPEMDGITLTKKLRHKYSFDEKIIIAISANTEKDTSSRFLKVGSNDFLHKPFNKEELKCRIDNNIKIAMLLDEIKNMAYKDELTKLYNRRYFYEMASKSFASKLRKNFEVSIIMLDIDHFKRLNDTYGHQTGDLALKKFSNLINNNVRESDILARYGGEEFILMTIGCDERKAFLIAENKIRKEVEKMSFVDDNEKTIKFTISAGVSSRGETLDEMIRNADDMLYKAKESRNRVEARFLHEKRT